MPADEEALAILEERLKGESEVEPRIDPNNPRRTAMQPPDPEAARKADLEAANAYLQDLFGNR